MKNQEVIDEIKNQIGLLVQNETLVVVEGKKDKAALNKLGVTNIITLNRPLFAIVEKISNSGVKEIALLVDMDNEGRKLYKKLRSDLSYHGVKINNTLRYFLLRKTGLKVIEGLDTFLDIENEEM